jgi:hypothetical protein
MSRIALAPGDGLANTFPDAALADRYNRLADETTGTVRRILLKLAHEAQVRHHLITGEAIDLHLLPNTPRSPSDAVRTYG